MNETKKTILFGGIALVLALIAVVTAPRRVTPDAFLDQGEPFFPEFENPNDARTLEVFEFAEETGSSRPFKVTFTNGRWVIPSHYNYPADAEDRLAETAAGVIGIRKDDFRTDNVADHEACGVIDPMDETIPSLKGRGKRITLKGEGERVLADFIIGNEIEDRSGFRFVRVPGQKRVYAARVDLEISTAFSDWIDADLMQIDKNKITRIVFKDYSVNEQTRSVDERDVVVVDLNDDDEWIADKMKTDEEVDDTKMRDFATALDELSIVGVRPKPAGLTASLTKSSEGTSLTQADLLSLQDKGFYITRDGSLRSNEGELQTKTEDGVLYTLRFGEVVYGTGLEVTAGTGSTEESEAKPGENRYLFITTSFDLNQFKEPPKPANTAFQSKPDSLWSDEDRRNKEIQDVHDEWQEKIEKGQKLSDELNARFAKWYYVISGESFEKLDLTRKDIVKKKEEKQ